MSDPRGPRRTRVLSAAVLTVAVVCVILPLSSCGVLSGRERDKGMSLYDEGRFDEAVPHLRRVLRWKPNDVEARGTLALALTKAGKPNDAIEEWLRVLKVMPEWADGHYWCGVAYITSNRLNKAAQEWVKAIEIDSTHVGAHYNLGLGYVQLGMIPLAIEEWSQLLLLDPTHYEARVNRGRVRVTQGDIAGALEDFLVAIAIKPDQGVNYLAAGEAYHRLADSARAVAAIDSFLAKHSEDDAIARKARSLRGRIVAGVPAPPLDTSTLGVRPVHSKSDTASRDSQSPDSISSPNLR